MTRRRLAAVTALAAFVLAAPVATPAAIVHDDRIRTLDPHLQQLVYEGIARSETFRAIVTRVQEGDVVVYIRYDTLPAGVHGRLAFLAAGGGIRYVMVGISADLDIPRSIGILGHELHHAVEIIEQPRIVDAATFAAAYELATYRRKTLADGNIGYDTMAAVHAGVQVWKELSVAPDIPVAGTR